MTEGKHKKKGKGALYPRKNQSTLVILKCIKNIIMKARIFSIQIKQFLFNSITNNDRADQIDQKMYLI